MAREIKFRIWYPYEDKGEMVEDVWIDLERGTLLSDNDNLCERVGHSGAVLMQYTGLKDKNGKEIYEGDVVERRDYDGHTVTIEVESLREFFEDKGYKELEYGEDWSSKNLEVIGNIYESPELITNQP